MNSILVFSAVCIGLASAGGHHAYHNSYNYNGGNLGGYSYNSGISQQRQLVEVPYSVEVRNIGGGSVGRNYGGSSSYQYHYQQSRPQIQVQRAQLVQQSTYSQPLRQTQQIVSVPSYSVQTVQRAPVVRFQPTYNRVRTVPIQTAPAVQYVSQPAVNVVPVNVGSPVVFGNGGLGGYSTLSSGSVGTW